MRFFAASDNINTVSDSTRLGVIGITNNSVGSTTTSTTSTTGSTTSNLILFAGGSTHNSTLVSIPIPGTITPVSPPDSNPRSMSISMFIAAHPPLSPPVIAVVAVEISFVTTPTPTPISTTSSFTLTTPTPTSAPTPVPICSWGSMSALFLIAIVLLLLLPLLLLLLLELLLAGTDIAVLPLQLLPLLLLPPPPLQQLLDLRMRIMASEGITCLLKFSYPIYIEREI